MQQEPVRAPAEGAPRNGHTHGRRFSSWQEHHGWSAAASFRRLASRPLGSLLTIAVMGLARRLGTRLTKRKPLRKLVVEGDDVFEPSMHAGS